MIEQTAPMEAAHNLRNPSLTLEATESATGSTRSKIRLHNPHKISIRDNREVNGVQQVLIECHTCHTRFWLPNNEWRRGK